MYVIVVQEQYQYFGLVSDHPESSPHQSDAHPGREEMAALRTGPSTQGMRAPVTMAAPMTYAGPVGAPAMGQVTYTAPPVYAHPMAVGPVTRAPGPPVTYGAACGSGARVTYGQGCQGCQGSSASMRGGDLFSALDTNGDGVLSREEMAALQPAPRPAQGVSFGGAVTYAT